EPENTGSWKDTPVPKTEKESEEEEEKPVSKPSPKSPHQAASPKPAGELKTATPMMILRVVIVNDGNITREELNTQAQANGFDLDSIPTALEILIEDGSILEQNDGNGVVYAVVE
ncbi:MAG: hypothetical protein PHX30_06550, partial [Candidatus Pacebacteria bacterium]|nr:hypothetical protein [Candidatus Paceibacterota bacterium]